MSESVRQGMNLGESITPSPVGAAVPACIVAAHGSRREPRANAAVWEHVDRLRQEYGFRQVTAAFHQGTPGFDRVLDSVQARRVVVIPFFSARGYYSQMVLPRQLARSPRFSEVQLTCAPPVGTHPGIGALAASRVEMVLRRFGFGSRHTAVVVVGHGTRRHRKSGSTTWKLVERLRAWKVAGEVRAAFLDQPPSLEEVFDRLSSPRVMVLPFLMGGSHHVAQDLPRRVGLASLSGCPFPALGSTGGREVVFDRAVGEDPGITPLLAQLALDMDMKRLEKA